ETPVVQGVRIDADSRRAWMGDKELHLTTKEFDLLRVLVRDAGKVVTREQIMREVWDTNWWGSTKTLDMHISWLRRKLGDDAAKPRYITTVRGVGFRFEREQGMRRRLLSSTLLVAAIAILRLGVPLGVVVSRLMVDDAAQQLRADATRLVGEVEYARIQETPLDPQQLEQKYPNRYIQIFERGNPPKATVVGTPPPSGQQMTEDAESDSGIFVRVSRDRAQVEQDVYARLLLIVALAVAALAVAVGLAIVQSRRLALPLRDLAMIAERLGSGDARPSKHRYGIPELDRVAQVLDRSATRI